MEFGVEQHTGEKLMRVVMFTLALSAMSVLMFNFVLPQISEEFGLTNAQVSWVTSSYALIYGIGTIIYGKLADRYKLKDLLTFGLLFFAVGSLIGLTSQTFWMVLVGRCMQAMGAAAIPATAMLIPIRYFSPERRGSALGMAFVGLALGSALGPVISALILSVAHWRWLFCLPFFILITLPFYRRYLGDERGHYRKLDWIGGGMLAVAVTLLLLSVTVGGGLFTIGGLLSVVFFIVRIRSVTEPFIQPDLFTIKSYTIGLVITFLISGIGFSLYYLSPLLLADIHHLPASWIGLALVPGAAASAILGRSGGRLADLKGNSFLFFIASMLLVACFILLSTFTGISPIFIAIFLILGNVGQTFMMIAMSNSVSMTLSKEQAGVGMGLLTMLNFIAGGMATGIYGKMVDMGSAGHWNPAHSYSNGAIYSNIFLILAALHVAVLSLYVIQFNKGIFFQSKTVGDNQTINEK
ncbi:MFS transporter [Bacillus sp. Marseille-Q3570]|uniref:MFS transporter n=1 Tax=Bacillus sp. Marseille-Q3570 TaxID=2963522 RepID=UPI0021B81CA6|nr:MFS transporter [Bacillus sp. Marseille-Q3570]